MKAAANVRIIPAKQQVFDGRPQFKRLNVAAYCRVSKEQEEQQNSYQVQIEYKYANGSERIHIIVVQQLRASRKRVYKQEYHSW